MDLSLLNLTEWDNLTLDQAYQLAKKLYNNLPASFNLKSVTSYSLGTQKRNIAMFEYNKIPFALIPGGEVLIGYDHTRQFRLNETEHEDWQEISDEYGLGSFNDYLKKCLTPARKIIIKPFLAEVRATLLGIGFPIYQYSQEVKNLEVPYWTGMIAGKMTMRLRPDFDPKKLKNSPNQITLEIYQGDKVQYVERPLNPLEILEEITQSGFRVPTSDEWEFICGAGSRSLFRWGDYFPNINVYSETSSDLFLDKSSWNLHKQPNAFGLRFVNNTYDKEICEGGIVRGGDGGSSVCGGMGSIDSWLPLATNYFVSIQTLEPNKRLWEADIGLENCYFRRIFILN